MNSLSVIMLVAKLQVRRFRGLARLSLLAFDSMLRDFAAAIGPRVRIRIAFVLAVTAAAGVLAACGIKGPLKPAPPPAPATTPAPSDTAPSAPDESPPATRP
jgi:predicted small lipoprotein YifL